MTDFWINAIETAGADVAFAIIVLLIFCAFMLVLMFFGLAIRAAWRWLFRGSFSNGSWNRVIVHTERKALRRR